jgi:hypothetical protein
MIIYDNNKGLNLRSYRYIVYDLRSKSTRVFCVGINQGGRKP